LAKPVEQGIREYLESLTAPRPRGRRSLVDKDAVKAIKDQMKGTSDPIARLNLARELREASRPKREEPAPHPGMQVFVEHGKAWADDNGYTAEDLQRYAKVPAEVLRAAGFVVPRLNERRGTSVRAPRLDAETEVLPVARKLGDSWRLTDLAEALDRDVATTRNYVKKLIASGLVEPAGVDAGGRGRAATLYKVR
jgi:hypothetical protein